MFVWSLISFFLYFLTTCVILYGGDGGVGGSFLMKTDCIAANGVPL